MFLRAPGLASGAQASSRSRKTWSAARPFALSKNRGLLPGTARLERRDRSSATVPLFRRRGGGRGDAQLPERNDAASALLRRREQAHVQVAGSTRVVGRLARTTRATPATTAAMPGNATSGGAWPSRTSATIVEPGTSSRTARLTTVGPTDESTWLSSVCPSSWALTVIAAISHQSRALNPASGSLTIAAATATAIAQVV